MKKFKKLIPAMVMLLIATMLMGTTTYAWFSMNTVVTASNMQVKAVAEQGIMINEVKAYNDTNWDNEANTVATEVYALRATSTANTKDWYVAYSTVQNSSASATAGSASNLLTSEGYQRLGTDFDATVYTAVDAVAGSKAAQNVFYHDFSGNTSYDNGEGYYVKFTYYLKSSAEEVELSSAANGKSLYIKEVTASQQTTTSALLDKALRVAVVINNKAYIFAPISGATASYYVNASSTATTVLSGEQATDLAALPATSDTNGGVQVDVYIYFEGEDANLMTSNVTSTLDNINVQIKFELKAHTAAVTPAGVSVS